MTAGRRKRRAREESESDGMEPEAGPDPLQDVEMEDADDGEQISRNQKAAMKLSANERSSLIGNTARMALFAELRSQPLKKDDLRKHICVDHEGNPKASLTAALPWAITQANELLRDVFGMSLEWLPVRKDDAAAVLLENQATSQTMILRNQLPMFAVTELVTFVDSREQYGFITLILALVFVHQNKLTQTVLRRHLEKLGMPLEGRNPMFSTTAKNVNTLEAIDVKMVKLGYLDKKQINPTGEQQDVEYKWGPRAKVECDGQQMVDFIASFYPEQNDVLKATISRAGGLVR